MQFRQADT